MAGVGSFLVICREEVVGEMEEKESQEAFKTPVFDWPMNQAKWSVRQQAFHQQEIE